MLFTLLRKVRNDEVSDTTGVAMWIKVHPKKIINIILKILVLIIILFYFSVISLLTFV